MEWEEELLVLFLLFASLDFNQDVEFAQILKELHMDFAKLLGFPISKGLQKSMSQYIAINLIYF